MSADQFRAAMQADGFEPPADIIPGKFHRFSSNGRKTDTAAFCKLFEDMRGGIYGNWRDGLTIDWQAVKSEAMSPADRLAYRQAVERAKVERDAEQAAAAADARVKAAAIWEAAEPANDNHPYLQRKQVTATGLRLSRGALVVPMRDNFGTLHSLQFIQPDGEKRFLTGGRVKGCYTGLGKPQGRIYIAEGYATAATVRAATGDAVAVAFNAGNLEPVAIALRERFPDVEIIIAADNDNLTNGNPGMTKAAAAARAVGAAVVAPAAGDFNDLLVQAGTEAVKSAVTNPAAQAVAVTQAAPAAAIDYISPLVMCNAKGKPLATIENLDEICRRLNITIRYNVIKKEDEILIPGQEFSADNQANASLAWLRSECVQFGYPTEALGEYVGFISDQNQFNPVIQWITSKPWDGVTRLQELYSTIQSEDEPLKETLLKRWMLSAVAAVVEPEGVSAHGVLVLQGSQYLGKTKWFKSLVPDHLDVVQDGHLLRVDDKDNVRQACSNWLVELGELDATFRKSDIAALKSFITKKKDVMRRAYAKKDSHFARRTVFFGSVNPKQFLHDTSGNRRYWTIECKHIDHSHAVDMQQVWAEFFEMYKGGERHYLLPDEMDRLNHSNEEFSVSDPITERLQSRLEWEAPQTMWRWRSATDLLVDVGMDRPTQSDVTRAATLIRQMNNNQAKRTMQGRQLLVPPVLMRP